MDENTNKEPEIILVEKYKDIPEDQFVPLESGIDEKLLGKYEINKMGIIRNIKTKKEKTGSAKYPQITFNIRGKTKSYFIHRLVALTFISNPNNHLYVDHIDRNPKNFNIKNLRWVDAHTNCLNRSTPTHKRWVLKLDDSRCIVEKIDYNDFRKHGRSFSRFNEAIRLNKKYKGFYWNVMSADLFNYIQEMGYPKDNEWISSLREPNILCNKNGILKINDKLTIGTSTIRGYRVICYKGTRYSVHRLIYEAFSNKLLSDDEVVDHIDTITYHNNFDNLSAGTIKDNMNNETTVKKRSFEVTLYDLFGNKLGDFISISSAYKETFGDTNKICVNSIKASCEKKQPFAHGFIWRYKGDCDILYSINNVCYQYDSNKNLIGAAIAFSEFAGGNRESKLYDSIIRVSKTGLRSCIDNNYYSVGPRIEFIDKTEKVPDVHKMVRPFYQIDLYGNIVNEFDSAFVAEEKTNTTFSLIKKCLFDKDNNKVGQTRTTDQDFIWIFKDEINLLPLILNKLIYRYKPNGELVYIGATNRRMSPERKFSHSINKAIETGELCHDGYYYSRGPRKFD